MLARAGCRCRVGVFARTPMEKRNIQLKNLKTYVMVDLQNGM